MDDWSFITLAKTKSDLLRNPAKPALAKTDTAVALDRGSVRGILAIATASLVNAAFFGAVESSTLHAHTPKGEVIVAEVELEETLLAQAGIEREVRL
jgi:hypothetical protein